jgi:purine-binding chemotaxis protein CheW
MNSIKLPSSGLAEDILREAGKKQELHLVTFRLDESYGVPITQVQEIIRVGSVTTVPNSPDYMEGVINLRGRVLPVLNLRKKLRLSHDMATKESRIVVTEVKGKLIGLLVDSVSHVMKVSGDSVEPAPEDVLDVNTDYITGVCKLPKELIILLDLERLLKNEKTRIVEEDSGGVRIVKNDGSLNS